MVEQGKIGFVLGGGGHRGAFEVMLKALFEADIRPDLIVGTSVGAFIGSAAAADPNTATVERLESLWIGLGGSDIFQGSMFATVANVFRNKTHLHTNDPLRQLLKDHLPVDKFEDLEVPFQCVAACIEDAAEHWFSEGSLIDAILASSAVPGLFPPVEIDGKHYVDGGVVNSIPLSRALQLGATEIYVLHVGHIEEPLRAPEQPWQVAMAAFEISRRHRFARDLASVPDDVTVHVLPTGNPSPGTYSDPSKLRWGDFTKVADRIAAAHAATIDYVQVG